MLADPWVVITILAIVAVAAYGWWKWFKISTPPTENATRVQ